MNPRFLLRIRSVLAGGQTVDEDNYEVDFPFDGETHLALVKGAVQGEDNVLVRVHSECLTGDVFGSQRCDCQAQLHKAMSMIGSAGSGVVVYLRQEGRGIGLGNKIRAYALQENGADTIEANHLLGFETDLRRYDLAADIVKDLGIRSVSLLTNNPDKLGALEAEGIVVERTPLVIEPGLCESSREFGSIGARAPA